MLDTLCAGGSETWRPVSLGHPPFRKGPPTSGGPPMARKKKLQQSDTLGPWCLFVDQSEGLFQGLIHGPASFTRRFKPGRGKVFLLFLPDVPQLRTPPQTLLCRLPRVRSKK